MDKATCVVDGCEKPRGGYVAGWCPMHYQRMKKHGSLEKPPPRPKPEPKACSVDECADVAYSKGLCARHYKRQWHEANWARTYARAVERRDANREQYLAESRAYYEANKPRILASMATRYRRNPEPRREAAAKWRKANPIKVREYELRRRALMRATQTEPVDYVAILEEHGMFCHICSLVIVDESDLHFDHVIPLAKGGAHVRDNIRPAHAICNMRKHCSIA